MWMQRRVPFQKTAASVVIAALLGLTCTQKLYAQENIEAQLKRLETTVFRKTYEKEELNSRIKRLEIMIFPGHPVPEFMKVDDRVEKLLFQVFKNQKIQIETLRKLDSDVILILMDCSHSMRYDLSDSSISPGCLPIRPVPTTRMLAAKITIGGLLQGIKPKIYLGFRVFGDAFSGYNLSDCKQTRALVPPGLDNRKEIIIETRRLFGQGTSPLRLAMEDAINKDLVRFTGRRSVVLLTDGTDSCGQDPLEFARELGKKTNFFNFDFGREDTDARVGLQAIAEITGGTYSKIGKAGDISSCLEKLLERLNQPAEVETSIP